MVFVCKKSNRVALPAKNTLKKKNQDTLTRKYSLTINETKH